MANGLDRLERFFTLKRKGSAVSTNSSDSSTAPYSPVMTPTEPSFPSPSFIRPKASRMAAREELGLKQSLNVSSPALDAMFPRRKGSAFTTHSGSSGTSGRLQPSLARSSSFTGRSRGENIPEFRGFQFPKPPTGDDTSPQRPYHQQKPLPHVPGIDTSPTRSLRRVKSSIHDLESPPSSDPEEDALYLRLPKPKKVIKAKAPQAAPPTPDMSPDIGPLSDWQLPQCSNVEILNDNLCKDIQRQLDESLGSCHFSSASASSTASENTAASSRPSSSDASLQEPDITDFLNLSDFSVTEFDNETSTLSDAESTPEVITVAPSILSLPMNELPLLTLAPPCASRPARAAAFESARIASRYNFDMIYVVNLWPEGSEKSSIAESQLRDGMTGRLLAAYGLQHCMSPFQISADVHVKILRSAGWLEYRDEQAQCGDFGRAYACAFYAGHYQSTKAMGTRVAKTSQVDRGIVFAAYRKPRADGSIQYSGPEELSCLRRDVEALVDMLIDVHFASRATYGHATYADETGPMPA